MRKHVIEELIKNNSHSHVACEIGIPIWSLKKWVSGNSDPETEKSVNHYLTVTRNPCSTPKCMSYKTSTYYAIVNSLKEIKNEKGAFFFQFSPGCGKSNSLLQICRKNAGIYLLANYKRERFNHLIIENKVEYLLIDNSDDLDKNEIDYILYHKDIKKIILLGEDYIPGIKIEVFRIPALDTDDFMSMISDNFSYLNEDSIKKLSAFCRSFDSTLELINIIIKENIESDVNIFKFLRKKFTDEFFGGRNGNFETITK